MLVLVAGCSRTSRNVEIVFPETRFTITAGAPAVVARELTAGTYSITVAEDAIDVRTSVDVGGEVVAMEDPVERHGLQLAYLDVPVDSHVTIGIASIDHRTKAGAASLKIERWNRDASAKRRDAEEGDRAYSEAVVSRVDNKDSSPEVADKALQAAIRYYAKAGDLQAQGIANYVRGRYAYLVANDWQAAERSGEAAKAVADKLSDPIAGARADILTAAARIERASELEDKSQSDKRALLLRGADTLLATSAESFSGTKLSIDLATALTFRGVGKWAARDSDSARILFASAVDIARESRDAFSEARALGNLAWLDFENANVHSAAAEYERLLELVERDRQPDLYASHVSNLGVCLMLQGDFGRALALHKDALELFIARGDNALRAKELLAIGGLHLRIGDAKRALETLETSLRLLREVKDQTGIDAALGLAGSAAAMAGDYNQSMAYHEELLARSTDPRTAARARVLIAGDLRGLRQFRRAAIELDKAAEHASDGTRASSLVERGLLRQAEGKPLEAIEALNAADSLYASLELDYPRIEANAALSRAHLTARHTKEALSSADLAIALIGRVRLNAASPELLSRFVAAQYAPYEARIAALLDPSNRNERVIDALLTAESVRARTLNELTRQSSTSRASTDTQSDRLRDQLTARQLRLEARLQNFDADDAQALRLHREIAEARARLDALNQVVTASSAGPIDAVSTNLSPPAIARHLARDTAILYFFVGDESTTAWLISIDGINHISLPGRVQLEKSTEHFVRTLRESNDNNSSVLEAVQTDSTLQRLAALTSNISQSRLFVSPDGPLNSMPFAALVTQFSDGTKKAWLDRFQLAVLPSLSLAFGQDSSSSQQDRRLVVLVADPVYALDDARLQTSLRAGPSDRLALRGGPASRFVRLPYSAIEASEVARAFDPKRVIKLTGFDAEVARVSSLPFDRLAVLHFATHAVARSDAPGLSALYLSAFEPNGAVKSRAAISSDDIVRLGMRADLVVLSACETGNGSEVRGEGVLGLTHSLLANGSGAVVASLWPIQDSATARMMSEFYRAYSSSKDPIAALQFAQQKMRQASGTASTSVWSSFVVRTNALPPRPYP